MGKRGPRCTVCDHDEKWRIELLRAGGASLDALATKFSLSADAIGRHWHGHVSDEVKAGYLVGPAKLADLAATAATEGASVLDHFRVVRTLLMSHLDATTQAGDARSAAIVSGSLVNVLEKIGKVTGEIATIAQGTINVTNNVAIMNSPQFAKMQAVILRALVPYGDARMAVAAALRDLDEDAVAEPRRPLLVIDHQAATLPAPPY